MKYDVFLFDLDDTLMDFGETEKMRLRMCSQHTVFRMHWRILGIRIGQLALYFGEIWSKAKCRCPN